MRSLLNRCASQVNMRVPTSILLLGVANIATRQDQLPVEKMGRPTGASGPIASASLGGYDHPQLRDAPAPLIGALYRPWSKFIVNN